jgi:hypothetical protein
MSNSVVVSVAVVAAVVGIVNFKIKIFNSFYFKFGQDDNVPRQKLPPGCSSRSLHPATLRQRLSIFR